MNVKNKVRPIVWNFARTRRLVDFSTYYTSIIRPHLEYASAVLYSKSNTNSQTTETIQNRCLRIIAQCHPHTPSTVLRNQLHIPTLKQRRTYLFICEFYQIYNNISNTVTENFMTRTTARPHYSLRNKNNLFVPNMNKLRQSVNEPCATQGPEHSTICQNLYKTRQNSQSFRIFKKRLKRYLLG